MINIYERYYDRDKKMREFLDQDIEFDVPQMPKWIRMQVYWPFAGAYARVQFYEAENKKNYVSVYLDVTDELGYMQQPYFEIYPNAEGDCSRFLMDAQQEMYPMIIKALAKRRRANKRKNKSVEG